MRILPKRYNKLALKRNTTMTENSKYCTFEEPATRLVSLVLSFTECLIVGITEHVAFSDWLLSFGSMHLSFCHVFHVLIAY